MFPGALREFNLAQVLELLHSSNQSGELALRRGQQRVGSINLCAGQLTHANVGRLAGLDALSALLSCDDALCTFDVGVLPTEQSLAAYPTSHLIDRLHKQLEHQRVNDPTPESRPTYRPRRGTTGVPITAREEGWLRLANGRRTIAEIARLGGGSVQSVAATMAKFRQVNLISLDETAHTPKPFGTVATNPSSTSAAPEEPSQTQDLATPSTPSSTKRIRYWRGRPIQ